MASQDVSSLQRLLHKEIPVSAEMGITIVRASPDLVGLEAPLLPNINYNGTAFGDRQVCKSAAAGYNAADCGSRLPGRRPVTRGRSTHEGDLGAESRRRT